VSSPPLSQNSAGETDSLLVGFIPTEFNGSSLKR